MDSPSPACGMDSPPPAGGMDSPPPACGGEGSRVGGVRTFWSASQITISTPSMFSRASLFQNRRTRYPFRSRYAARFRSRSIRDVIPCCPPSISITSFDVDRRNRRSRVQLLPAAENENPLEKVRTDATTISAPKVSCRDAAAGRGGLFCRLNAPSHRPHP